MSEPTPTGPPPPPGPSNTIDLTGGSDEDPELPSSGAETSEDEHESGPSTLQDKGKTTKRSKLNNLRKKILKPEGVPNHLVDTVLDQVREEHGEEAANAVSRDQIREMLAAMKIKDVAKGNVGIGGMNKKDMGAHKFWSTQPVSQPTQSAEEGPIDPAVPASQVRQEPYPLPKEYEWVDCDLNDPAELKDVQELLSLNYVEDDDASFRFNYTGEFLAWALKPPGYQKSWHVGVRVASGKRKLVAFISAIPMTLRVNGVNLKTSEVNFLCVHKKLRSKRLAPVLIKEITRRCNILGVFQASYTAGVVLPGIIGTCQYYHRALNPPKLVETGFSHVPRTSTLGRQIRLADVPRGSVEGWREMERRDIPQVGKLVRAFLARYQIAPIMDDEEIAHVFLSGRGTEDGKKRQGQVTWAYVVENPTTKKITDFLSFYSLPSTIVGNLKYPVLDAAYLFYYATDAVLPSDYASQSTLPPPGLEKDAALRTKLGDRLKKLVEAALRVAKAANFDVFNALTLMDNNLFIQDQRFKLGSGFLNYYMYNYRVRDEIPGGLNGVDSSGVGLVML